MSWKVVSAGNEEELQQKLDELQTRLPRSDDDGDFHLVGTISQLVPIGIQPQGTMVVAVNVEVARDPPVAPKS